MRSLSPTLLAAQTSASSQPYLQVRVWDRLPTVARPILERLYTGTEPDFYHAAIMAADGSLVRVRVELTTERLYVQRVANPGPGSAFGSWTLLNPVSVVTNPVLVRRGSQLLLFYVDQTRLVIVSRESNDHGASWSQATTVQVPPASFTHWLAADTNPSGLITLFYVTDSQTLYVTKKTGAGWSAPVPWSQSTVTYFTGLSCVYHGDWNLVVCGNTSSGDSKVWTVIYGDGGAQPPDTWSQPKELTLARSGSQMDFRNAFIARPDQYRLFFSESYTGPGTYNRPLWSFTTPGSDFGDNLWREPIPFDLNSSFGVAMAYGGGYLWLSTPSGVWRGSLSGDYLDLSEDVLEAEVREEPERGRATLVLRNDDGRYNTPGSGTLSHLRRGSQVTLAPGYQTSSGVEVSQGPTFWVQGWEHRCLAGQSTLVLYLEDAWALLEGWRARRQYAWAAGQSPIQEVLTFILSRVGLELVALSASPTMTTHKPEFTIHPGQDGASVVRRLLALVPDVLFFRDGKAFIKHLQPSDPLDYSYGTSHPVLEGRYLSRAAPFNRVQTYGSGVTGEAFGWTQVGELTDRLLQVHDLNLDTQQKAQERADALVQEALRESTSGEVVVPTNCGQELYDIIEVTDSRAGLAAARRRVLGMTLRYATGRGPRYTHTIKLGAP